MPRLEHAGWQTHLRSTRWHGGGGDNGGGGGMVEETKSPDGEQSEVEGRR